MVNRTALPPKSARHAKFQLMPRGRHRTSLKSRRLLPPKTALAVASACVGGALATNETTLLRVIVVVAAVAVCTGASVQRRRERVLEREVSRLQSARIRDEWRTDEKIAELESDLEEYRELCTAAERKLNAKRAELARLRGEHAALLKRYALAESERAKALESTRLALAAGPEHPLPTPSAYLKARVALDALEENAARQEAAQAAAEAEEARRAAEQARVAKLAETARSAREAQAAEAARATAGEQHLRMATGASGLRPVPRPGRVPAAVAVVPPHAQQPRRPAAPEPGFDFFGNRRALSAPRRAAELSTAEDLADVVGEEVAAAQAAGAAAEDGQGASSPHKAAPDEGHTAVGDAGPKEPAASDQPGEVVASRAGAAPKAPQTDASAGFATGRDYPREENSGHRAGQAPDGGQDSDPAVIDLTEHDEAEAIDVRRLRALS